MVELPVGGNSLTSTTLLVRLKAQEPAAWRQLAELYGPLVYSWVRLTGLNEHDAADVVQEVFTAVHKSLDRFRKDRPTDRFRDWLWTITRRRACDHIRKSGKHPSAKGGSDAYQQLQEFPDQIPRGDDSISHNAEAELVGRALEFIKAEFEERTWNACVQTVVDGRKPIDVAADLGMSVGAVYVARSRVLKRLRQELGDLI